MNNETASGPPAKQPSDAWMIAEAEKHFALEDTAVAVPEPTMSVASLSDADLIAEVKKRPQITAKALGLSAVAVEEELEP
jgi:hypothetical protein